MSSVWRGLRRGVKTLGTVIQGACDQGGGNFKAVYIHSDYLQRAVLISEILMMDPKDNSGKIRVGRS